jgi:hypothetical protein
MRGASRSGLAISLLLGICGVTMERGYTQQAAPNAYIDPAFCA